MQQGSHSVAPSQPIMVLLPDAGASSIGPAFTDGGEPKVLGLGLARRTVMAASRAGYTRIYLLARDRAAPAGITAISNWSNLADACAREPGPLIIAHASILAEPDWLMRLTEIQTGPARWAAAPHKMILLAAPAVADALAMLQADKGAYDLMAAQERLTRHFGAPAAIPAAIDPLVVSTPADVEDAEWRLLRGLVKDTDGFMARNVERPISLRIARRFASTAITPNQITLLSVGIGLCGALFFLSAHWFWQTIGALLFLAHSILDGCDGELARLKFHESRFGGIIDYWGDNVVHIAVFACMMLRKKLDHPVTIGVTDRIRRIHDHRACVLSLGEAIKHRPALAHREYICAAAVQRSIGLDKLDAEAARRQRCADAIHDGAIIIDAARRVVRFAVDTPAGFDHRTHGSDFSR